MTAEPREERISAYLDDELSADERADVEKWLAESAEHRQLLEDLRALRIGLRSLPRHQLDSDLGSAVLRRAERSVLSGAKATAPATVTQRSASQRADGARQWWAQGGKRRVLWPVAALAAALLIALFDNQREPPDREVALGDAAQHAPRGESQISALPPSGVEKETASVAAGDEAMSAKAAPSESDFDHLGLLKDQPAGAARTLSRKAPAMKSGGAAEPAAAAPANADATLERAAGRLIKKKDEVTFDEPVELVVCDVDPEFIEAQQLEHVLKSNRVSFKRLGAEARQRDVQSRSHAQQSQAVGVRELYEVNAAPEQVRQIITDLQQVQGQVSNVAVTNYSIESRGVTPDVSQRDAKVVPPAAPAKSKSNERNSRDDKQRATNLVYSSPPVVTFWLRVADGKQPNLEPAAAPSADDPPTGKP